MTGVFHFARALALAVLLAVPWGSAGAAWTGNAPPFDQVRSQYRPSDIWLLDRHGEPIERLRVDAAARRGDWVRLPDISPALRQALVLSEDRRFYQHSGVDWRAVSAAAWGNLWHTRTRGASTLTMQLAGLLESDLRLGAGGRSLRQKIGQALMARRLESEWRKDQILEAYLNLVPWRGELVGIAALSRTLFDKAPHGLQDSEAAIAAALVRAPNARPAEVARRACRLLTAMHAAPDQASSGAASSPDCAALEIQTELALSRHAWPPSAGIAPHLARRLLAERGDAAAAASQPLRSTLDAGLQRLALRTLQQQLRELSGRHVEDGAVVVLDNASGQVLAWVGSSGELSRAAEVDGVTALRQPGSTLKPFLYAQAIAERRLTAASLLDDSPTHIQTGGGLYIPQDYDHWFKGWVSVRTALAASLNVPAVRALIMVSPDAFARQLGQLGITLKEGGDYYGYSLALGSAEVTLLQLTNAYRALANGGRYSAAVWQPDAPAGAETAALDPGAAFIVGNILSDANARVRTFGPDSILSTRVWSAVKTGTSKDMRDNWAVGWTARYTIGVWVGNASGQPMWDVSGTSGAAPVWAALVRYLHRRTPSPAPRPPFALLHVPVRFDGSIEAARQEWFLPGTAQALFALDHEAADGSQEAQSQPAAVPARITAPQEGTILALDPDIPPTHQRLTLLADAGSARPGALRWWIDRHETGRGPRALWLPWPGHHLVQLRDAQGHVYDQRRVEVRGAAVKQKITP